MKYSIPRIDEIIFSGKQKIPWNEVEIYMKKYIGQEFVVKEYGDKIVIAGDFPDEYTESRYTKKLRGALAKVKANMAQIIDSIVINATNRRWIENKDVKATLAVRKNRKGLFLYDVIDIKKEASTPLEP